MRTLMKLTLLPLRAPMVLLLLLISTYLGMHWSRPGAWADAGQMEVADLIWSAECLQALVVVVICTIPDLLLRRISSIMAASRVASLVVTLLLVITGGLYLLHLEVLSNVLILASSVMLARLDLVRLRVVPPPFVMTLILSILVLGGISLGRNIEAQMPRNDAVPHARRSAAASVPAHPAQAGVPSGSPPSRAAGLNVPSAAPQAPGTSTPKSEPSPNSSQVQEPSPATPAGRASAAIRDSPAPTTADNHQPDRAIPHLPRHGDTTPLP